MGMVKNDVLGTDIGAGSGFNPLSILSGPLTGLPGFSSSASSSSSLTQLFDSPFNVGAGELINTPSQNATGTPFPQYSAAGGGFNIQDVAGYAALGLIAWILVKKL
jgi:hypothetical protein